MTAYALTWTDLRTNLPRTGEHRYATEYEAARNALYLEKYLAGRGFTIPHKVVRVDEQATAESEKVK